MQYRFLCFTLGRSLCCISNPVTQAVQILIAFMKWIRTVNLNNRKRNRTPGSLHVLCYHLKTDQHPDVTPLEYIDKFILFYSVSLLDLLCKRLDWIQCEPFQSLILSLKRKLWKGYKGNQANNTSIVRPTYEKNNNHLQFYKSLRLFFHSSPDQRGVFLVVVRECAQHV